MSSKSFYFVFFISEFLIWVILTYIWIFLPGKEEKLSLKGVMFLLCKKIEVKDEKGLVSINLVMGNRDHSYLVVSIKYWTEHHLETGRQGIKNRAQKVWRSHCRTGRGMQLQKCKMTQCWVLTWLCDHEFIVISTC